MDCSRALAIYLLYRRRRLRRQGLKRFRMHWVHPVNQRRDEEGGFSTLYQELRRDSSKFCKYFGMSLTSFDELLGKVKDSIQLEDTVMRNCIKPEIRLAATLRYLASGCSLADLHRMFRIGTSTACKIVRSVCQAIWSSMKNETFPIPTKELWERIAADFEKKADFPHCLGAIDGKHIRLMRSLKDESTDSEDKVYFSVVLIAIADTEYRFVYVDIGAFNKDCLSSIYRSSSILRSIESVNLSLPTEKRLPGSAGPKLPYAFVADDDFVLHRNLLRPFRGRRLSAEQKVFNNRLERARRYVESAFGILTNKWRILQQSYVQPDFAVDIVRCCVVLHNFLLDRDGFAFEDTLTVVGLEDLKQFPRDTGTKSAQKVRRDFSHYFMSSVGSLPWQMNTS